MLDSIYVATSGLTGHQKGLKTISGNVSNLNSPGFKGLQAQFTDVFLSQGGDASTGENLTPGGGLRVLSPMVNFSAGELRETDRDMDVALDGPGFFVVQNKDGETFYTKNGRFDLNADGQLVLLDTDLTVMAAGDNSTLTPMSISALRVSLPKTTTEITLAGNLSSTGTAHVIDGVKVFDSLGQARTVKLDFKVATTTDSTSGTTTNIPGTWDVTVLEGTTSLGTGQLKVSSGLPDPLADRFTFQLTVSGGTSAAVTVLLSDQVTGFSSGTTSTLATSKVDGNAGGTVTSTAFDNKGALVVTYTNTLKATGPRLAIAEFAMPESLEPVSGTLFAASDMESTPRLIEAGSTTKLKLASLELSNVDLTDQFSTMILIQRGFQASSQVLSTASEMIQSLYDLKSRR
jgi:flagellar hook protein FlgE